MKQRAIRPQRFERFFLSVSDKKTFVCGVNTDERSERRVRGRLEGAHAKERQANPRGRLVGGLERFRRSSGRIVSVERPPLLFGKHGSGWKPAGSREPLAVRARLEIEPGGAQPGR